MSSADSHEDFQRRPTYMIRRLSAELGRQVDRALREFSLTGVQLGALSHLKLAGGSGLSGAELAERVGVTPQSMSSAVGRLIERGLVERHPRPDHGRILEISITAEGTALRDRAQQAMERLNARIVASLDEAQRDQLMHSLAELMDVLDLSVAPPAH